MFTSRLKDTDNTLFCCRLKIKHIFFLSSSICYLFLLTPLSHMYYSLQSQLFFLNKRHSFCSRTLFIYHNSNSDNFEFFRRIIFLVLKASKKNVLKFTEHFFFLDTLRGYVSKQSTPKVSGHCCFEIIKEIAYRESRLQKHS